MLAAVLSQPSDTFLVTFGNPQVHGTHLTATVLRMNHTPTIMTQSSSQRGSSLYPGSVLSPILHSQQHLNAGIRGRPAQRHAFLPLGADLLPVPVSFPAGESPDAKLGLGPGYIVLIVVAVFAVVTGAAALLIVRYQRVTGKYNFETQPDNFSYQVFQD